MCYGRMGLIRHVNTYESGMFVIVYRKFLNNVSSHSNFYSSITLGIESVDQ